VQQTLVRPVMHKNDDAVPNFNENKEESTNAQETMGNGNLKSGEINNTNEDDVESETNHYG